MEHLIGGQKPYAKPLEWEQPRLQNAVAPKGSQGIGRLFANSRPEVFEGREAENLTQSNWTHRQTGIQIAGKKPAIRTVCLYGTNSSHHPQGTRPRSNNVKFLGTQIALENFEIVRSANAIVFRVERLSSGYELSVSLPRDLGNRTVG